MPDVIRTLARSQGGPEHLGLPPGAFLLGDPADAVALDAEQPLDARRPEALGELQFDERHDRDLVLAQPIVGRRGRHADRLPDDHQQFERDAGPLADLLERLVRQGGEPLVGGRVEEVERERAALDGGPDGFERDPGILERPAHQYPTDVAAREAIRLIGREDAELDQPVEIGRLDPDPLGGFLACVCRHGAQATPYRDRIRRGRLRRSLTERGHRRTDPEEGSWIERKHGCSSSHSP